MVEEKLVWDTNKVQQRRDILARHALLITEEGPLRLISWEEVVEIIGHHFDLLRYEFRIFRSSPEPFIVLYSERSARDVIFARERISDGPFKLCFHSWEVDGFSEQVILPYHVKLSIEVLPQDAWFQYVGEKVPCDKAVMCHID
jgi:hypothetical protein